MKVLLFALLASVFIANCSGTANKIFKVRLESCPGCSLNRLTEVRRFFYEDVPLYENVEWKKISGAQPIAIFLDEAGEEIERHSLSAKNREECNELLQSRGFKPSSTKEL